jgi:hypothetical protein
MDGRALRAFVLAAAFGMAVGCGSDKQRPDTGAGANEPVPPTLNCVDLCARLGSCVEVLCNEDTNSSRYTGLGDLLAGQCEASCTESLVQEAFTSSKWMCLFSSSCRQVFDYDTCHADSNYHCT